MNDDECEELFEEVRRIETMLDEWPPVKVPKADEKGRPLGLSERVAWLIGACEAMSKHNKVLKDILKLP